MNLDIVCLGVRLSHPDGSEDDAQQRLKQVEEMILGWASLDDVPKRVLEQFRTNGIYDPVGPLVRTKDMMLESVRHVADAIKRPNDFEHDHGTMRRVNGGKGIGLWMRCDQPTVTMLHFQRVAALFPDARNDEDGQVAWEEIIAGESP